MLCFRIENSRLQGLAVGSIEMMQGQCMSFSLQSPEVG